MHKFLRAIALFEVSKTALVDLMKEMNRIVKGSGPADEVAEVEDGALGQNSVAGKFKKV